MQRLGDLNATDPDELSELVTRSLGLTASIKTDGSRPFVSRMSTCVGSLLAMIENRNEADVYAHFPGAADAISFVLLDQGHVGPDTVRREKVVDSRSITVVDHKNLRSMNYYGNSDILTATIDKKIFREFAFKVMRKDIALSFDRPLILDREDDIGCSFAQALRVTNRLIGLAADRHIPVYSARRMEEAALASLLRWFERVGAQAPAYANMPLPRQVRIAMEIVDASDEPIQVTDLASQVCVSARSLQLGFRNALGMSPLDYIKRHRLKKVREAVLATGTAALRFHCHKWGFSNYSRFRADYIEYFGEDDWRIVFIKSGKNSRV